MNLESCRIYIDCMNDLRMLKTTGEPDRLHPWVHRPEVVLVLALAVDSAYP